MTDLRKLIDGLRDEINVAPNSVICRNIAHYYADEIEAVLDAMQPSRPEDEIKAEALEEASRALDRLSFVADKRVLRVMDVQSALESRAHILRAKGAGE